MTISSVRHVRGLAEIAGFYDGFILDVWGVLHDGIRALPDTVETLEELKHAKRTVWLLSNAPRRVFQLVETLEGMGIRQDLYDGVVTSGEATWKLLHDTYLAEKGRHCFEFGDEAREGRVFEGLDIELVDKVEKADFVVASDIYGFKGPPEKYKSLLEEFLKRELPMVCANPDKTVHVGDHLMVCAGAVAELYEKMGGEVTYVGKPHRLVYSYCLSGMGLRKVLAVGDGMPTDIAGATGAGLDSALVMSGIHRDALYGENGAVFDGNRLENLLRTYPYRPAFTLPKFCW